MIRDDQPSPGFYRMKLVRGGHPVGIRIWFGAPLDPVTREELDRSHRWQANANGRDIDFARCWPQCAAEPITEAEYRHLCRLQDWAEEKAPESAIANPRRAIDLRTAPLPF